ncbi:DNA alkylation repair protein [Methanohalophilus halophilus]|uniref:3-methyladenine DNA glycosylase AlkD n=1 Tax=Methanohalophilus halophilus TaxID=2177 RepID=A0A1L3Q055_9EURY|nr:DNA alkylation repair protein [Methanohalophilus halophilus]APH38239.1 DNA alkylation repair protein [Methanohalophilus halophilus]RNI10894.1 DNA alkylation repair protein [Methanohalophilus halophilus]SDV99984.1 3-methyladenine DNA glycosylase AlkD [Methanohalophilus halophilus]
MTTTDTILEKLYENANPTAVDGMKNYGITPSEALGISIPILRSIAKEIGTNHELALELWNIDLRETRILASMMDEPSKVTTEQMDRWARDFDYWEICDQCCMNLFEKTSLAWKKAFEWSGKHEEFVKRAGFVMMARLAVSDKQATDENFLAFFPVIEREAVDGRNMVKKAVNWALRQIGKRSLYLNNRAIECAERVGDIDSKSAGWIASDALRQLRSEKVLERLNRKAAKNP